MDRTILACCGWAAKYQRLAGDRQEHRALVGKAPEIGQHAVHRLRLHRQHDDLGRVADIGRRSDRAQPRLTRPQRLDGLSDDGVGRGEAARQPSLEHGAAHLACAAMV
jgi:hypothetical protein